MKPFLLIIDSLAMPGNRLGAGRMAFIDIFVFADSTEHAEDRAIRYLNQLGWLKIELMASFERPEPPQRSDEKWAKAYRQAEYHGIGLHVNLSPIDMEPGFYGETFD